MEFSVSQSRRITPDEPIPAIKTALRKIPAEENALVWFGHSSYLLQVDEKRILVDPVFCMASPVSFVNKPFRGTEIYSPDDMPDIDYPLFPTTIGTT